MRKKEEGPGIAGQGGGHGQAGAHQGRQRSDAMPGPQNMAYMTSDLLGRVHINQKAHLSGKNLLGNLYIWRM